MTFCIEVSQSSVVSLPSSFMSPAFKALTIFSNRLMPFSLAAHSFSCFKRYFSVTISRIGPTSCDIPPWTSTIESNIFFSTSSGISSLENTLWLGSRHPLLIPNSGAPFSAVIPAIIFIPGQRPPESCQPPPEPPSHSPSIDLDATVRLSSSEMGPVISLIWPLKRIKRVIIVARRVVLTAKREPFGMPFTLVTISIPPRLPNSLCRISGSGTSLSSRHGGTMPEATTPALSRER